MMDARGSHHLVALDQHCASKGMRPVGACSTKVSVQLLSTFHLFKNVN
jgi:hypothetical protein